MHKSPKGYAEKLPLYYAAIEKAALENPTFVPPTTASREECISVLAGFLAEGNCGAVVLVGGRRLASHVLSNIARIEDFDTCIALRDAIEHGFSLSDGKGKVELDFSTPTRTAWLSGDSAAGENTSVGLSPSVDQIREQLSKTYTLHRAALPSALFEPQLAAVGLGSKETPNFNEFAEYLSSGLAGDAVFRLGREFCRYLLPHLEAIGAYGVCRVLARAVDAGVSVWDGLGYLPADSAETNMPDAYGSYKYLEG
jgi:hypothetical protein